MEIRQNLNSDQVAKRIGLSSGKALEVARHRGTIAIPVIRIGKRGIRYDPADVEKWLEANKVIPGTPQQPEGRARRRRRLRS